MSLKETVKKFIPSGLYDVYRERRAYGRLRSEALWQLDRYNRSFAKHETGDAVQCEARVVFYSHQIEKGLSHTEFRLGFGENALRNLAKALVSLQKVDPNYRNNEAYKSAVSALKQYRDRHEDASFDIKRYLAFFPEDILKDAEMSRPEDGGSVVVTASSKKDNQNKPFEQLFMGRRSVREYANRPVTKDEIRKAVQIAMKTPTVCNRQPVRVHVIMSQDTIRKALALQGGFNGYDNPAALLLIAADNRVFLWPNERNEGYTDGGLFGMSLLLALEAEGLAACPLNTMMPRDTDEKTRELLHLPDSEYLVMYIAVGHFADSVETCVSKRFDVEKIMNYID